MAVRTGRAGRGRDVVGRLGRCGEVAETGVAVRAVTCCRVLGVGYKEGARCGLRSGLEAFEGGHCGDGVLAHAHPHVVALVAVGTAAANARVNHGRGRRGCEEAAARCALGRNTWHQRRRR